jgi:hypothetical protein
MVGRVAGRCLDQRIVVGPLELNAANPRSAERTTRPTAAAMGPYDQLTLALDYIRIAACMVMDENDGNQRIDYLASMINRHAKDGTEAAKALWKAMGEGRAITPAGA